MIFPGFPGVLSFFQVFQVEWEPWLKVPVIIIAYFATERCLLGVALVLNMLWVP